MRSRDVLIITALEGAENLAAVLSEKLGTRVEIARTQRTGLHRAKSGEFGVVVVEEHLVAGDPEWADRLWAEAGSALPMQVNFALTGGARLAREVKGAFARMQEEQNVARRDAVSEIEAELKGSLTGLLLQSELAMREPPGSAGLTSKLQKLVELAAEIRGHFDERGRRNDRAAQE